MNPTQPAVIEVAKAATRAWSQANIANADNAVGLGVVAGLLLVAQHESEDHELGRRILAAGDEELAEMQDRAWCAFTIARPDLAFRCGPFGEWLDEEPRRPANITAAAAAVARAVVKAGLLELVPDRGSAQKVDVLGHCNLLLRDHEVPRGRGQFSTPAPVAAAVASMALGTSGQERSVTDSYAGTGELLRAAAAELREAGESPHDFWWCGCDVDPVVVAALAVNLHAWDVGPHVVVGCADVLREPNWKVRAAEEQRAAVAIRQAMAADATLLAVARAARNPDRGER